MRYGRTDLKMEILVFLIAQYTKCHGILNPHGKLALHLSFGQKYFFYIQSKPKKTLYWDQKKCTSVTHFDVQNSTYAIKDHPNGMAYINRGSNCKLFIKLPNLVFNIFYQISKLGKLSIFYIFMHFGTIPCIVTILNG